LIRTRYYESKNEHTLNITDLLLVDSQFAEEAADQSILLHAILPWINLVDQEKLGLNSALPFQLVTVFRFLELDEQRAKQDIDMLSTHEETKESHGMPIHECLQP
jgi:hypothetical protein